MAPLESNSDSETGWTGATGMRTDNPLHAFTVDVEDYYQVLNFQRGLPRSEWAHQASRVVANTTLILELLEAFCTKGTFFILGCVAEAQPELVKEISRRGHEVASHGFSHTPLNHLTEAAFLDEAKRSRQLLQDLSGQPVNGFRAPSFSLMSGTLWGLDALLEAGYRYDSSVFPVRHPDYGIPDARKCIHAMRTPLGGEILEFPMTTVQWMGRAIPISGGGYFRLFPYSVTRWGWNRVNATGHPGVFYLHPWEVDPDQPSLRHCTSRLGAFRHYTGLSRTVPRLKKLLGAYRFGTMASVFEANGFSWTARTLRVPEHSK
jgi:polysaccharide deacetylase family protein (PEP-CTERM system associated)